MEPRINRDIDSYLGSVAFSDHVSVLVEGISDKIILERLQRELQEHGFQSRNLRIDSAERIDSPVGEAIGNRQKVERVAQVIFPAVRNQSGLLGSSTESFAASILT
jgi:hypothetical protein